MRTPRTSQTNIRQVVADYQRVTQTGNEYDRKQVYQVRCGHCDCGITNRGMNAVLLSDRAIQLFSTDLMPNTLGFVHGDYCAASCSCRVRDTACLKCGNVVGYHVNVPCKTCLSQPNNGHYWMFRSADVRPLPLSCQSKLSHVTFLCSVRVC
ncbi:FAM72 protein-domain-containing protein [Syncephalastrum racemosum]|uniref:FAM72 protein-domain-containing protein n=1 Tax=Syncephalastrum racemosum TaxID=13706 RepID=A0A1X2HTA2_SYNRA|nr:FAM72 protein-domain-containing protein [Syncephalastrum racemosum]